MSHESDQHGSTDSLHKSFEMSLLRDKQGLWSGTQVYHVHRDNLATLAPINGAEHPDYPWLTVDGGLQVTGEEGDWLRLDCPYAGFTEGAGEEDEPVPVYTLDMALSEEPLETHPRYVDNLDADEISAAVKLAKTPPKEADGTLKDVDTSGWDTKAVELYDNIRKGFDKFRDPKVTWSKAWVSSSRPTNLNDIGEIATPGGTPPTVAAGRNWLFIGLVSVERGAVFENTEIHELSGRGGWNTTIYA